MKDSSNGFAPAASASGTSPGILRGLFIWSHERGTLPYDIICALILAFVFFMPKSCFAPKRAALTSPAQSRPAASATAAPTGTAAR